MSSTITQDARKISSQTRTINVRVPIGIFDQLDALATSTARTKSFVAVEALSSYLETQTWQTREILESIAEMDQGEFATDEEVHTVFAKYGA